MQSLTLTTDPTPVSLLRPDGPYHSLRTGRTPLNEVDLGLSPVILALDTDKRGRNTRFIGGVLTELNADPAVIAYRQAVMLDLEESPALVTGLGNVLPHLNELSSNWRGQRWNEKMPLHQIAARLGELDAYLGCVEGLWAALDGVALRSEGFLRLKAHLANLRQDEVYQSLSREVPALRDRLRQAGSVTVGINLDAQLRPQSATILSVNAERVGHKGTLLERLLGNKAAREALQGVTGLYKATDGESGSGAKFPDHELFRELNTILERIVEPIAKALERYRQINSAGLAALAPEIAFWLGAINLTNELTEAGLTLCRPQIAPVEEKACRIEGNYNLELALRSRTGLNARLVPNDLEFGSEDSLFVLTGPNSGGKTTYIRAVGQAQVLFQAGLRVPGRSARLSPVDAIFTHFASAERVGSTGGRLEEELERLSALFGQAGPHSLILLNEPLASTDYASARVLGRDLLVGLQLLGARAVYVTHLHELVEDVPGVVSLVAGVNAEDNGGQPTYTIRPGRPSTLGYAAELARRHGLSLSQIEDTLRGRGLEPHPKAENTFTG